MLDTYHAERQPLGRAITQAALDNSLSMGRTARQTAAKLPRSEFLNEQGLIFGGCVRVGSGGAGRHAGARATIRSPQYMPVGTPRRRAPHVWLQRDGGPISTIDLFGRGFVLLTGSRGEAWLRSGEACRRRDAAAA